jgi:hypothetical protein
MPTAKASNSTSFRPCPEGVTQGVLVDIIDLGLITSTYDGEERTSPKVNFVWQMDERKDDGTRFLVFQRFTLSLHPKASLRKVVETLRGSKFTNEEAESGYELDELKGSNALLTIVQNSVGDRVYANVGGVAPLMKNMKPLEVEAYERRAPKGEDSPF